MAKRRDGISLQGTTQEERGEFEIWAARIQIALAARRWPDAVALVQACRQATENDGRQIDPGASIANLGLSAVVCNALEDSGVLCVGQLAGMTSGELAMLGRFGKMRLAEIDEALAAYGITRPE